MKEKEWYTTGEVAKILGVSFRTIKRWIYSGKISAVKTIGGHYRIHRNEIERLRSEVEDRFATDIIKLVEKRKVMYFREVQINFEGKYRHYETRDKLRSLVGLGKLNTAFKLNRRWYFPIDMSWDDVKDLAKEKLELVKFFEGYERKFERGGISYLDYSEYLVEQALIRAGYTVVAKDTYYFNGLVCLIREGLGRPPDLDFIAALPNKGFVGIQVKNRLEYPKPDDVNVFIELCRCLHLKPLLITRQAHPMTFDVIRRLGGWTVVFRQKFLKLGFPVDKLEALRKNLGFPVAVYKWPPDYLIRRLIEAAEVMNQTMTNPQ